MIYRFSINYQEIESKCSVVEVEADSLEEAHRKAENMDVDDWIDTDNYNTQDVTKVQKVADKHFNNLCQVYNKAFKNQKTIIEPFIALQEFKKAVEDFVMDSITINLATIDE